MHTGSLWQYTHLIHPSEAFFSKHKWNCVREGGRLASNRDRMRQFSLSSGQSRTQWKRFQLKLCFYWKLSQHSFFGRIEDTIICFRDCLTFRSSQKFDFCAKPCTVYYLHPLPLFWWVIQNKWAKQKLMHWL